MDERLPPGGEVHGLHREIACRVWGCATCRREARISRAIVGPGRRWVGVTRAEYATAERRARSGQYGPWLDLAEPYAWLRCTSGTPPVTGIVDVRVVDRLAELGGGTLAMVGRRMGEVWEHGREGLGAPDDGRCDRWIAMMDRNRGGGLCA